MAYIKYFKNFNNISIKNNKPLNIERIFSEELIKEFKDDIDWEYISINIPLSEEFIRKFKDKVSWNYICIYHMLSEDFIREFKNNIYI